MIRFVALLALVLCLVPIHGEEKKNPLQGKWKLKSLTSSDADERNDVDLLLTFDSEGISLNDSKERFKYRTDLNASPALIDITTPDNKELEGIWEVKSDTLRLCICSPQGVKFRPTEFHGRESQILLILERIKE